MKTIVKNFFINLLAFYLVDQVTQGLYFGNSTQTYLLASIALTAILMFAKPAINILLLPINLVTFGVFRWVSSAVAMYLVGLIVKDFEVKYFYFSGLESKWLDIPEITLSGIAAYVIFAFMISVIISFVHWVIK